MKPVVWIGSSLRDLREFPEEVRQQMGYAIYLAQQGSKHPAADPLRGFRGAGVLAVAVNFRTDTYRVAYTVRYADVVCVLHAFKKKSRRGVRTPRREMDVIRKRLLWAEELEAAGDLR